MNTLIPLAKALSDESRIRAIMMLRSGELCVCQIIETLKLAPATVSKHLSILHDAGIVHRSKRGRWAYYRLADRTAPPAVRQAIKWVFENLQSDEQVARDAKTICCVREVDLTEISRCYGVPSPPTRGTATTRAKNANTSQRKRSSTT